MEECDKVLHILESYERVSGQKVNRSKTALFFSKSTHVDIKTSFKHALGVQEIMHYEKYLGLPSLVGKGKKRQALTTLRRERGKTPKLGREVTITSREGGVDQISNSSSSHLHYGML